MSATSHTATSRMLFHRNAYQFVFQALQHTQGKLDRFASSAEEEEENAHISGKELLLGIQEYALEQFGLLTTTVFKVWGIHSTDDFGRMVFELIERGEMRKTENDELEDFFCVYDFQQVFDNEYVIPTDKAFQRS